jgi:N utilization substance protein A
VPHLFSASWAADRQAASAAASSRTEDKGGILAEYGLSEEQGNEIIMAARAHWFEDEPVEEAAHADSTQ